MRRWTTRFRGGHRDPAVEAEAQRAYRLVLDEARLERIAELEAKVARLERELRIARTVAAVPQWMSEDHQIRTKRLDGMTTSVVPAAAVARAVERARRR